MVEIYPEVQGTLVAESSTRTTADTVTISTVKAQIMELTAQIAQTRNISEEEDGKEPCDVNSAA